jgi:hypothetical protein
MTDKVTRLTPGTARKVGNKLRAGADALANSHFKRLDLADGNFGDVIRGQTLAREYALSYHVLAETMTGFESDLNGYGEAIKHSAEGLGDTDAESAELLYRIASIIPTANDEQRHDAAWNVSVGEP